MKFILLTSLALVAVMIIGCGSGSSNPARSTAPETAKEIAPTPARAVTLPGNSKITPTQVQIRLPQVLSQSSDEIKNLERRVSELEKRLDKLDKAWKKCFGESFDWCYGLYP